MLNSAHLVILPNLTPSPFTWPIGAAEKPSPIAPPIILKPLIRLASSGYVVKRRATLVNAPVATSHALPSSCAKRAVCIASVLLKSRIGSEAGFGRRSVPSMPLSPASLQQMLAFGTESVDQPWISGACTAFLSSGFEAPG